MDAHRRPLRKWKVADLRENPHQQELFGDLPNAQLDELAADMNANGQRDPVEILPDGTVIDGHQRWRAAVKLGWTEVDVVVRDDLATASEDAVEQHMINVNLHRRQMDPLAIARVYKRAKQIERGWDRDEFSPWGRGELRDRLAKRLGAKSGRTLDRYLRLLDAPRSVQDAVSRGALPMQTAFQVLLMGPHQQEAIARAIAAGQDPRAVIAACIPGTRSSRAAAKPSTGSPTPPIATESPLNIECVAPELQDHVGALRAAVKDLLRTGTPMNKKRDVFARATALFCAAIAEIRPRHEPDAKTGG